MKQITIIIATYNAEMVLPHCLESIRSQKTEEIELIIADGLSKDKTIEIIEKNNDIIDIYFSEKDEGIYDAWNKAISQSSGEWIMFLGADDKLRPNALSSYISFLRTLEPKNYDVVSSKLDLISENGIHRRFVGELYDHQKYCERKLQFAHPGMLHNRRLFNLYGGFNVSYKICADCEFFIKNGQNFRAAFMDCVTVEMKQGGASVSFRAISEAFAIRRKYETQSLISNCLGVLFVSLGLLFSKMKTSFFKK